VDQPVAATPADLGACEGADPASPGPVRPAPPIARGATPEAFRVWWGVFEAACAIFPETGTFALFLGNIVGFDKTPWPLLLTILNLPQLSIMISLQVSANRAQAASDRRAIADHETLIALHEMAKQQIDILKNQDQVLDILHTFAAHDMPGRQRQIQDAVNEILAVVAPEQG
jgi:hypothetical protein